MDNRLHNQRAWLFVLPVVILVAFNAVIPLMTVVNYSVQETFGIMYFSGMELNGFVMYYVPIAFMIR